MTFEEQICKLSNIREGKLLAPSKKASENPTNGIEVKIPAAINVIKDCATIANAYLPLFCFGSMANPFGTLKGQFTLTQIKDFITRSKVNITTNQLLRLILDKGRNLVELPAVAVTPEDDDDPYGDYIQGDKVSEVDDVYVISKLFGVI